MSRFARRLQQASRQSSGPIGTLPQTPDDLVVTTGNQSITLWWTTSERATGYDVQYKLTSSGTWTSATHEGTLTQATVQGLTNGAAYHLRVRATNSDGSSAWSAVMAGTPQATPVTTPGLPTVLNTTIVNNSGTNTVYVYIVGLDPTDGRWTLVSSDGQSTYKPPTPSTDHTALAVDCAIPLNAIGATGKQIKVPRLISGRIFFSYDQKMQFFINANGGFVMPSQLNVNDENIDIQWTFAEFTFNSVELYGNISFVDMLSIPVAFTLNVSDGTGTQYVPGLPAGAMGTIAQRLNGQKAIDGTDWDKCLFYNSSNELVRVLSPNSAVQLEPTAFTGYLEPYINQVWAKYTNEDLTINTGRGDWGIDVGRVSNGILDFGSGMTFAKPSTAAVWSCSIPPFTTGNDEQGNLTARLTAAFNRTTLLINNNQPDGEDPETYYKNPITNHYSRIVHEEVYGNLGYAFPYDDVHPAGGISYEGRIQSSNPSLWTISVGQA